jgi:hypothetical protein
MQNQYLANLLISAHNNRLTAEIPRQQTPHNQHLPEGLASVANTQLTGNKITTQPLYNQHFRVPDGSVHYKALITQAESIGFGRNLRKPFIINTSTNYRGHPVFAHPTTNTASRSTDLSLCPAVLRPARTLFRGDAFDDRHAAFAYGERNLGLRHGSIDQRRHLGIGECFGSWQTNEAVLRPAAQQDFVWVGKRRAPVEREPDAFGICNQGGDAVRRTQRAAIADDKKIVIVVHDLVRGREALAQYGAARTDLFGDRGIEFGDEAGNLLGGRRGGRCGVCLVLCPAPRLAIDAYAEAEPEDFLAVLMCGSLRSFTIP